MIDYIGRGNPSMYDDYIDFINYVFAYYHNPHDFKRIMPYRCSPEHDPCSQTYFVVEDGKIKASIGAFDTGYKICGEKIKSRGIGNVSVHPYSQHKGYMIRLMNMITYDMISDGVDFSYLGGRRQRYGYFGYEQACARYSMGVDRGCFRYVYGGGRDNKPFHMRLKAEKVGPADSYRLDFIKSMSDAEPMHAERPGEFFFDYISQWTSPVWVFVDESGRLRGYSIGEAGEMMLDDDSLAPDAVWALLQATGDNSLNVNLPLTKPFQRAALMDLHGSVGCNNTEMIMVLNWRRVIAAALRLEAAYFPLAGGEITVLIHGTAGDEKLRVSVSGGVPSVEPYDGEAELELDRLRAVSFFFGVFSPEREALASAAVKSWLPLPLTLYSADGV